MSAEQTNSNSDALKKILLVEDDNYLADVYKTRLIEEGFDVKHIADGEGAVSLAVTYKPDLIVLDIMMPKVSGFDVLKDLRQNPVTQKTKVMMVTARASDEDRKKAEELKVDDYLVKSQVIISDLVERIKQHLGI